MFKKKIKNKKINNICKKNCSKNIFLLKKNISNKICENKFIYRKYFIHVQGKSHGFIVFTQLAYRFCPTVYKISFELSSFRKSLSHFFIEIDHTQRPFSAFLPRYHRIALELKVTGR